MDNTVCGEACGAVVSMLESMGFTVSVSRESYATLTGGVARRDVVRGIRTSPQPAKVSVYLRGDGSIGKVHIFVRGSLGSPRLEALEEAGASVDEVDGDTIITVKRLRLEDLGGILAIVF
ncbi:hypothetical protein apy_10070 [Aeropyrum pernix]|uniref:Uncharacterized protein n=1 Tax=Aeropyrum pernix TaxID=56636 RepID=A0A401HAA6_AERPX|nr:hypothetical protein [Aeropyrum pernix]GBF09282.1 hypothetical protein apy_10070 [Aeropyrum pernix]